jgi:hypothetical protein
MIFPLKVSDTMRIPLQNRSVPRGALDRIEVLTLRAKKKFFGKKRYDNLMMLVEIEPLPNGKTHDIFFGRCVAFYQDKANQHFVAVHWYEKVGLPFACTIIDPHLFTKLVPTTYPQALPNKHFDLSARLMKVKPMRPNHYGSYDIMPVGSILNGALLVQDRGTRQRPQDQPHFWVRQSPREYNYLLHYHGERPLVAGQCQLARDRLL